MVVVVEVAVAVVEEERVAVGYESELDVSMIVTGKAGTAGIEEPIEVTMRSGGLLKRPVECPEHRRCVERASTQWSSFVQERFESLPYVALPPDIQLLCQCPSRPAVQGRHPCD